MTCNECGLEFEDDAVDEIGEAALAKAGIEVEVDFLCKDCLDKEVER